MPSSFADILDQKIRAVVREELERLLGNARAGAAPSRPASPARTVRGSPAEGALCEVVGCGRPHRSKGYCASHYQSARKRGWPMPAPKAFRAPPVRRGRPPKNADVKEA